MASPSVGPRATDVCPGGNHVELADVVRRFAPEYTSRYGPVMMPSQKRALADIAACCTADMGDGMCAGLALPCRKISPESRWSAP